ncbi:glycosyltransferase family 4 protein [Sphingomonas sp. MMS24-J45]|uniref:glycosyltransferase family 4 protein n=1 Tax=Sphingomonas sp. MMS24-J45 TaxID=3238806 RepID=UPI00384A4F85
MSSNRPILHIVPSEPWGGIQALVPMLAREQVAQGRQVTLLCLGRGERVRTVATQYGLGAVTRSISGPLAPLRLMLTLLATRNAIIHTHCEPIWTAGLIALSGTSRWIEHAHVYPDDDLTWKKRLSRRLQRLAAHHIAISHSIGRAVIATGIARPDALAVVYNGVADDTRAAPSGRSAAGPLTVGFVGRVVAEKGIFDFLELAAALASDSRMTFAVYGDGSDLAEARARAAALGIADRVVFHGYVEDIAAAWDTLDLVAIFSHREPFGLVFLEAVQRGVPSISYANNSGGSEVAAVLRSAYRVQAGDIAAAANIVRDLAEASVTATASLALDRATVATRFDIATMARGVDAVYRRLEQTHQAADAAVTSGASQ